MGYHNNTQIIPEDNLARRKNASQTRQMLMHFLIMWKEYNKDNGLNRYRKTDFAMGIIQGFSSKLKSQSKTKTKVKDRRALIKIEDPLLKKYVRYKYPRTYSVKGKALSHDDNVVKDGVSVGRKLVISKGITERGKSRRFLIENKKDRSG